MQPIYLDCNATTPIDPSVLDSMLTCLRDHFGNPSSAHVYGKTAHDAMEKARGQVAQLLGAEPDEIVFTSGGSEADNQALLGPVFRSMREPRAVAPGDWHVITSAIEHPAILETCAFMTRLGCQVTILPVDGQGVVDPESVRRALDSRKTIVSIMHSNNEVGTLQPIEAIAAVARDHGALMHTDAAQSMGKVPVDVRQLGVDMLSIAGHKMYAPKGAGVLFVRRDVQVEPLIHGAGHEGGRRAGTENVPYIVGLGTACDVARRSLAEETRRLRGMRDRLWQGLQVGLGESVRRNGHPRQCLPNTLNVSFLGHTGSELLARVPGIAASTGSACHEGNVKQSPVLSAMGVPVEQGRGAVRLTAGRFTTCEEIDRAVELLIAAARGAKS